MANSELIDTLIDRGGVSKQIKDTTDELEALDQQIIATAQSANALNAAIGKSTNTQQLTNATNNAAAAQQRLGNLQTQGAILQERLTQAQARSAAQQAKSQQATTKLTGEYQKLLTAYNQATLAARNAGASFGVNSIQFQATSQQVQALRGQLDAIDQPLGNFQRNVGNYASGIGAAFTRAYSGIRTLANILPGLGISGIFLLAFQGIKYVTEQMGFFKSSVNLAAENLKNLNEVNANASKQYGEQATNLKILYTAATDVNNNMHDRILAVRELQKEFPDTFKNIKIETILNGDASKSYKELTDDILENAKARAAATKIQELASKQQEIEFQKAKILSAAGEQRARVTAPVNAQILGAGGASGVAGSQGVDISVRDQQKKIGQIAGDALRAQDQQSRILQNQIDFLMKYAGGNNKIAKALSQNNTPTDKKPTDDRKKILDQQLKDQKLQEDAVLNNTSSTLDERLSAIDKFEVESYILINKAESDKVLTSLEASNDIKSIENDAYKDRVKIAGDAQKAILKIFKDGEKQQSEILKNSLDVAEQYGNQQKTKAQENADENLTILSRQYSQGEIKQKEYQKKKAEIEKQAAIDADAADVARLQMRVGIELGLGEDAAKDLEDLEKAKRKLAKDTADYQISEAERAAAEKKVLNQKEQQLGEQLGTLIQTAIDARYTNELNNIQDQKDELTKQTQTEIDAVNRSVGSEASKADKIAVINAKAQAQQDALDLKQRQVKQKQAETDRLFTIARIIEQTALAIVEALPNIPLSIVVGAIGAAELATVLATPLPKFKDGVRNKSIDGLGIWGEAGTELGIFPDGRVMLSPDKATIADMPKGTSIFSHKELISMIGRPQLPIFGSGGIDIGALVMESKNSTRELKQAFTQREKVSGFNVNSSRRSNWEAYKKRNLN